MSEHSADKAAGPKRIQRKRTKGSRMPEGAVYVGRPSRWGNPFAVGDDHWVGHWRAQSRAHAVELYREILSTDHKREIRENLAGRDLACWCPLDQPCHADVLLELANTLVFPSDKGGDQ